MAYGQEPFIKIKDGVKAPSGFHYMPNGKLMNDADHIAANGYATKTINSINIDLTDISCLGETRVFSISGDNGGFFSLEVYDNSNNYYNFYNKTWSSTANRLNRIKIAGAYNGSIFFQANTSSLKNYTINLIAETVENVKTKHVTKSEFRNVDNSININKSSGSDSNVLKKVLYQDVERTLYLSCIAPSLYATVTDTVDGATSSSTRAVFDNTLSAIGVGAGDLLTSTDAAIGLWTLVNKINPDGDNAKEIEISRADSLSDGSTVTFTPPFNGVLPHSTDGTTGRYTITTSSGANFKVPFYIAVRSTAGRTIAIRRTPDTNDLCSFKNVTFGSSALAIVGEDTSSSTYYRWPVTNIAGLSGGMVLDPSRSGGGTNTTSAILSSYITTISSESLVEEEYSSRIASRTLVDVEVPAVDSYGNDITAVDRNGVVTAQEGNITFNTQQADALKSDSNVRIFGYGKSQISSLTGGMEVALSDVELELDQVSTTTSAASSASTTIALDAVQNISVGSIVRGPGINASVANPTVVSKSAQTGAGNIVVSSAQTLEDNQTLYFDGRSSTLTITGTIEVSNMTIADTTIYFDLEKFLHIV